MNKTIIYPFNFTSSVIVRYKDLIKNINIISCIAPNDIVGDIKDVSFYDEGIPINMPVYSYSYYENELNKCDTVIWGEYNYVEIENFFESVINDIKKAIKLKKNIICLQKLDPLVKDELNMFADFHKVIFTYYDYVKIDYHELYKEKLKNIDIPVIMNYSMLENSMKFNTQLILKKIFENEEYRISQIGTKHYSGFFNIHPYPDFMFNTNISDRDKILCFNTYINDIIKKEKSDLCIIGVPGEIMPFNNAYNFNFGIMAYLVSCAVKPDYTILNTHYLKLNDEYINNLKGIFKYKFGNLLNNISQSNIRINDDSYHNNEPEYEHEVIKINNNYKEYDDSDICIINITDPEYETKILGHIYNQLSHTNERIV